MFCRKCGSSADHGVYCSFCGNRLLQNAPTRKKISYFLKFLIGLMLAGGLIGYGYYSFHQTLTQTVSDHFTSIRNKKITEAYYNYAAKELQGVITLDGFRELVATVPALADNARVKILESTLDYPYGIVKFALISKEDEEISGEYKLYRENGKWKIYEIELALPEEQLPRVKSNEIGVKKIDTGLSLNDSSEPQVPPPVGTPSTPGTISSQQATTNAAPPENTPDTSPLMTPIAELLNELKQDDLDKVYHTNMSGHYVEKMSFDDFKKFVNENPILTKFKTATFKDMNIQGDHGTVTVILDPSAGAIPVDFTLVREGDLWVIDTIKLVLNQTAAENPKDLTKYVEKFLQQIRAGATINAYTEQTTKKFQEITPFNVFQEFISNFPIMTEFQKIDFSEPEIKEGVGTVTATVSNQRQKMSLFFTLGVEENTWKIWGVRMVNTPEGEAPPKSAAANSNLLFDAHPSAQPTVKKVEETGDIGKRPFSSDELDSVVQSQLRDLAQDHIQQSYDTYSSKEFKDATPYQLYDEFIQKYPVLKDHKAVLMNKLVFNNNIPTFTGTITSMDNRQYQLEYDFVKEDNQWKILHMSVSPKEGSEEGTRAGVNSDIKKPLEFTKALIGNTVDKDGNVIDPRTVFKAESGSIFVNLYIANGVKGTKIEMVLKHLDSGSSIPPISTTLQDNGSAIISYDFSSPSKGWPKGYYSILASSSNGENKEFVIRIE